MAPEVVGHKGHAFAADWWCVGILTYECMCGTTPFASDDPMTIYRQSNDAEAQIPELLRLVRDLLPTLPAHAAWLRVACML